MSTKRAPSRRPAKAAEVVVRHTSAPDAAERLARAYDLILRAAAQAEAEAGGKQPSSREVEHDG